MPHNIQSPFSWTNERKPPKLKPKPAPFSNNIRGICVACGFRVQRIKIASQYCPQCYKRGSSRVLVPLPLELLPWQIRPNSIQEPFTCHYCALRMFNYAVMGSLCKHKKHSPPNYYTCRFCCKKVDSNVVSAVEEEISNTAYVEMEHLGAQSGRAIRTTAPPPGRPIARTVEDTFEAAWARMTVPTFWTIDPNLAQSTQPIPESISSVRLPPMYEYRITADGSWAINEVPTIAESSPLDVVPFDHTAVPTSRVLPPWYPDDDELRSSLFMGYDDNYDDRDLDDGDLF